MGSLSLVVCSLTLWLGIAVGDHVNIYPPPQPKQHPYHNVIHSQLPDCAPEFNEITQYKTVVTTRDVYTTQIIPEVIQTTVYNSTNYVTETTNTVETVYTPVVIRSNIQVLETSTSLLTAYTAVPTTFTETSTRTQFDINYAVATAVLTKTLTEPKEQFVPVSVTQTVFDVNPVTQTTTSTITSQQFVAATVSFTEQITVPVVVTITQTIPVPAVTSTVVRFTTHIIPFTQTVPSETVIILRDVQTSTVTTFAQDLTVTQTLCPLVGLTSVGDPNVRDPDNFSKEPSSTGPTSFDVKPPGAERPAPIDVAPSSTGSTENVDNRDKPSAGPTGFTAATPAVGPTEKAPLDVNPRGEGLTGFTAATPVQVLLDVDPRLKRFT